MPKKISEFEKAERFSNRATGVIFLFTLVVMLIGIGQHQGGVGFMDVFVSAICAAGASLLFYSAYWEGYA